MDRYGLIGQNIGYSKSPLIHQFMAKKLGLEFQYDLLDMDEKDIPHLFKHLRRGVFRGFNVTIPHKQSVMRHIDILTPKARRIQAVNTIYMKGEQIVGDNTDYDGFLGLLTYYHIDVKAKRVYILGSGGAAKAAYIVLEDLGAHVTVVTRNKPEEVKMFKRVITYQDIKEEDVDLFINATPIGTYPKNQESVLPKHLVKDKIVIDLIYNPEVTTLMQDAKKAYNGLMMLIIQALKSEEIWFNRTIELTDTWLKELKEVIYHE
jgi:shikimate dehydrogenase